MEVSFTLVVCLSSSSSLKKKDGDLASALTRIKELDSLYIRSEAALSAARSESASLGAELADLKAQITKVCCSISSVWHLAKC